MNTGTTASELLMKRRLRTNLDHMKPATSTTVYKNQKDQKFQLDRTLFGSQGSVLPDFLLLRQGLVNRLAHEALPLGEYRRA